MTKYHDAGKGDATRPTNHDAFSSNFDQYSQVVQNVVHISKTLKLES